MKLAILGKKMFELGAKVIHIPSNKECFVVYHNDKEPKYKIRFLDKHSMDMYTTELEVAKPEEQLLASEPALEEVVVGDETLQVKSKTGIKEKMKGSEEIKINKGVKK